MLFRDLSRDCHFTFHCWRTINMQDIPKNRFEPNELKKKNNPFKAAQQPETKISRIIRTQEKKKSAK